MVAVVAILSNTSSARPLGELASRPKIEPARKIRRHQQCLRRRIPLRGRSTGFPVPRTAIPAWGAVLVLGIRGADEGHRMPFGLEELREQHWSVRLVGLVVGLSAPLGFCLLFQQWHATDLGQ